jgi:hypothetical protein
MITASPLEIAWSAVMLLGAVFQAIHVWRAVGNYRTARDNGGTRAMLLLARQKIRNHVVRLVILAAFLLIGVVSMLLPEPARTATTTAGALVASSLLLVGAVVVLDTLLDHYDWPRLIGGK